jgi:hypothetical protein
MTTPYCPRTLYKYFSPERASALDSAMLRYTPQGGFNDPFEGRPEITELSTDEQALETFAAVFPEEAKRMYQQLPEPARVQIPFKQFMVLMSQFAESKKSELLQEFRKLTPLAKGWFHQKFDEHIGALCLSEVPDSLLMWSHYAASHTGFVLEFNAHHPCFHERRSESDEFRHLRRVLYRDARPSAPLSEMEGAEFFLVKSAHWSYEREWRIMRALSEAHSVVPCEPFPIHLFSFPREAVVSVILGARSTEQTEHSIRTILRSHEAYGSVVLKRAVPNESHFLLNITRVAA